MMAHQMIFSPGEAEQWMATEVYPELNMEVDAQCIWQLRQASEQLTGVWVNAAFLLDEGRPEEEVIRYFAKYMVLDEQAATACIKALRNPLIGHYLLIYYYGQQLMTACLQGQNRLPVFQRWLTEHITPSQLEDELNSIKYE